MAKKPRIPPDVLRELDRHELTPDSREWILAVVEGASAVLLPVDACERLKCSRRTLDRLRTVHGDGFKLNPDARGLVRIPRALLVRILARSTR